MQSVKLLDLTTFFNKSNFNWGFTNLNKNMNIKHWYVLKISPPPLAFSVKYLIHPFSDGTKGFLTGGGGGEGRWGEDVVKRKHISLTNTFLLYKVITHFLE